MKDNPLFKGVWTWSRGGGWGGPYIKNEFWIELNAYVISHWASNPLKTEKEILYDFEKQKGFPSQNGDVPSTLPIIRRWSDKRAI